MRARSSSRLQCSPQTLSSWVSSVLTHSLLLMVQSFTSPSEPLRMGFGKGLNTWAYLPAHPTPTLSQAHSPGQQLCATAHKGHLQHRRIVPLKCLQGWDGEGKRWQQVGGQARGGGSLP